MYDPTVGRFMSEDLLGFSAGDENMFRYVGNSTPNRIDPSGLVEVEVIIDRPEDSTAESAESIGWYMAILPRGEVGVTQVRYRVQRLQIQKMPGQEKFRVLYKAVGEAHIYLDVTSIEKLSKLPMNKGLSLETAYGHEQRHLENSITILKREAEALREAEKQIYKSLKEAEAAADKITSEVQKKIEDADTLEKAHESKDPPSPGKKEFPDPIGKMPPPIGKKQPTPISKRPKAPK